eukprot:785147-Prymnesium_polylepis.1
MGSRQTNKGEQSGAVRRGYGSPGGRHIQQGGGGRGRVCVALAVGPAAGSNEMVGERDTVRFGWPETSGRAITEEHLDRPSFFSETSASSEGRAVSEEHSPRR